MKKTIRFSIITVLMVIFITCTSFAIAFAEGVTGTKDEVDGEITLTTFTTDDGASIRYTNPIGIRFLTSISEEDLNKLPTNAKFGTLVIGTKKLAGAELTFETASIEDIEAKCWYTGSESTTKTYSAVIGGVEDNSSFPADYYAMNLTARGYVKYTDKNSVEHIIYSDNVITRSVSYVATAIINEGTVPEGCAELFSTMSAKAVTSEIAFSESAVTVPALSSYSLSVTGANGMPIKYTVPNGVTLNGDKIYAQTAGEYEITATCGSKTCTMTFTVAGIEKDIITNSLDMQVFTANEITSAIDVDIPTNDDISVSDISKVYGATLNSSSSGSINVTLSDTSVRGESNIILQSKDNKLYSLKVIVADQKISTGSEFMTMMRERISDSATIAENDYKHYYVLSSDITLDYTKYALNGSTYEHPRASSGQRYFNDGFDGRGYIVSGSLAGGYFRTKGLFSYVTGSVKNVIVKNPCILDNDAQEGALATAIINGAIVENNVVINPMIKSYSDNKTYGALACEVYTANTIIRNNLVVETVSSITGLSDVISAQHYNNDGSLKECTDEVKNPVLNIFFAKIGGSANIANITDNYAITTHNYSAVTNFACSGTNNLDNYVKSTYLDLKDAIGSTNLSKYLIDDDGFSASVGNFDLYTYPITENLVSVNDSELFEINADREYEIAIPQSVNIENITKVANATIESIDTDNNKITVIFNTAVNGEVEVKFMIDDEIKSVYICIADNIIYNESDYINYVKSRMLTSAPSDRKYFVLGNDITLTSGTGNKINGDHPSDSYKFYDTFNGRGFAITPTGGDVIWNNGLFCDMQDGAVVKNLIVKDVMIRGNCGSGNYTGAIAFKMSSGSMLDNVVVINPVLRDTTTTPAGMLVGYFVDGAVISNCLVFDFNALNGTSNSTERNIGTIAGGLVGKVDSSSVASNITNSYAVTTKATMSVVCSGAEAKANTLFTTLSDFFTAINNNVSSLNNLTDDGFDICFKNTSINSILSNGKLYSYPIISLVSNLNAELFVANENGQYNVSIPNQVDVANITNIVGATLVSKDTVNNKITITISASVRGEQEIKFVASGNAYSVYICVADELITTKDQFMDMLSTRIVTSAPASTKYFALANDIKITADKGYTTQNYQFYDTFDGRGHKISNETADTPINCYGIFANLAGIVKNLIVDTVRLRTGGDDGGIIAFQMTGTIENVVVMNASVFKGSSTHSHSFLVGKIYSTAVVKNCLVIDLYSLNGTRPLRNGYNAYADYTDAGILNTTNLTERITGIIGFKGGSANMANVTGCYCITKSSISAAVDSYTGSDLLPNAICDSFTAFTTKANISDYTLLSTDANGVVSCGGVTIYTPAN